MKTNGYILIFMLFWIGTLAQDARFELNKGNKAYLEKDYTAAEAAFRNALIEKKEYDAARFNLGNTLFRKEAYEESRTYFKSFAAHADDKIAQAHAYHNIGNSFMKESKLEEAVHAYKQSLRLNPKDDDTRYNLAVAQKLLQQQQNQQQNQKDQKQDHKQDQQQDNQNQQNKDKNKEEQKDKENQQDGQNQEDKKNQEGKSKPEEQKMSKEQAERLLQMINEDEKNIQDKLMEQKRNARKLNVEKDW